MNLFNIIFDTVNMNDNPNNRNFYLSMFSNNFSTSSFLNEIFKEYSWKKSIKNKFFIFKNFYFHSNINNTDKELILDRFNQAKLNKPISKQALKRWFSNKYLEEHPKTYDLFMNILNKKPDDHKSFLKAYELFANHYDDIILMVQS